LETRIFRRHRIRRLRAPGIDSHDEAHKEDHEDLLDQLRNLMDQLVSNPDEGIKVLKESLSDWFERHFATFDARLHGQLENRG
jgi:hemerythrin